MRTCGWTIILAYCVAIAVFITPSVSRAADQKTACEAFRNEDFAGVADAPTWILSTAFVDAEGELPQYCEIHGYVAPHIGFYLALPSGWNGKFQKLGCAGYCGTTRDSSVKCADALREGYACATSDMGHTASAADAADGAWAYGNLQAKVDWGFRATHVATLASKVIIARYYGSPAKRSYFLGCSTGGRQGLQEAQRFPWDFDGIVAGAPPVRLSTTYMSLAWAMRVARDSNGQPLLAKKDLKLLHTAVTDKCDLDDGVRDGILGDPIGCSFDPEVLTCGQGGEGGNMKCLTRFRLRL